MAGVEEGRAQGMTAAEGATETSGPVARYGAASEANDLDALMSTLSKEVAVVSPISGRMVFEGHDDVRVLLAAVYGSLTGLHWSRETGDDRVRVLVGDARVGPVRLGDAMVFELDRDGQITRISPHIRPWLGLTALAIALAPRMLRHPAVLVRALRSRTRLRP
jgi:hypothetical protein